MRIDFFYRIVEFLCRIQIQNRRNGHIVRHTGTSVFGKAPEHFDIAQMRADKQRSLFSIELFDQQCNVVVVKLDFIKIDFTAPAFDLFDNAQGKRHDVPIDMRPLYAIILARGIPQQSILIRARFVSGTLRTRKIKK